MSVIDELIQKPNREELDRLPSKNEVRASVESANKEKASGDNDIPVEYWQALLSNVETFNILYDCVVEFWQSGECPKDWLVGRLKLLPKKGDLQDLNNWRGIMLLDTMAKVVSSIISKRLQRVLLEVGIEEQNGFMPRRGCVDGIFSLKVALQKRREHGLDSWLLFIDLIKALDTVPREMLFAVLEKFGIPPHLCGLIINLHMGCIVKINVGESDVEVCCTVGVKQGDNLAPILFIIFMQAVLEIVHQKWQASKPSFRSKK